MWDGNYYALEVTTRLGLEDSGGMLRVGSVHYNTLEERVPTYAFTMKGKHPRQVVRWSRWVVILCNHMIFWLNED